MLYFFITLAVWRPTCRLVSSIYLRQQKNDQIYLRQTENFGSQLNKRKKYETKIMRKNAAQRENLEIEEKRRNFGENLQNCLPD